MKQKNKAVTLHEVRLLFENKFPELLAGAVDSPDEASLPAKDRRLFVGCVVERGRGTGGKAFVGV